MRFLRSDRVLSGLILAALIPACTIFVLSIVGRFAEDSAIGEWIAPPTVNAAAYVEQRALRYSGATDVDVEYSTSGKKLIHDIHFVLGGVPNTGELSITLDTGAGSQYDRTLCAVDMADAQLSEVGLPAVVSLGEDGVVFWSLPPGGLLMEKGDVLKIEYNNPDLQTYGLTIVTSN